VRVNAIRARGPRCQRAFIPAFDTPQQFAAGLARERQTWAEVIRRNNIVAD
jgi:hypothetical protein